MVKTAYIIIEKVNFWFCFFKENNIKIHLTQMNTGLSNVVRQISISN